MSAAVKRSRVESGGGGPSKNQEGSLSLNLEANRRLNSRLMDETPAQIALRCHLIQVLLLSLVDFSGLLKLRLLSKAWLVLANGEIRRRGGFSLQFYFEPTEKEYIQVQAPSKIFLMNDEPSTSSTLKDNKTGNLDAVVPSTSSGPSSSNSRPRSNASSSRRMFSFIAPPAKKYLKDLAEILGSTSDFPCSHFSFTGGDLKSGGAREFFYHHGENVHTLILSCVSPSEETFVSLLQCQAPYVSKLSCSLALDLSDFDWVPEDRRYLSRDPTKPPVLLPFKVNLEPLSLPCLEILHFGEEMMKRDWRRNVALQLVVRAPNLRVIGNPPIFQFSLPFWAENDNQRLNMIKEFTICKTQNVHPAPVPPAGMDLPALQQLGRQYAEAEAQGLNGPPLLVEPVVQPQIEAPEPNVNQAGAQAGTTADTTTPAIFMEGIKALKDLRKFGAAKLKLKIIRLDLGPDYRSPLNMPTPPFTTRHLATDIERLFTSSRESLRVVEWEFLDTLPRIPGVTYDNVKRLTLQINTGAEQIFKPEVVQELFPNLKYLCLKYTSHHGWTMKRWEHYFNPPAAPTPPPEFGERPPRVITSLNSVEELELDDSFPCMRAWEKLREILPNLKKINSYAAAVFPRHGQLFVYWPTLESIEWKDHFKLTREESRLRVQRREHQLDSKILEHLAQVRRDEEKKVKNWRPEPELFSF